MREPSSDPTVLWRNASPNETRARRRDRTRTNAGGDPVRHLAREDDVQPAASTAAKLTNNNSNPGDGCPTATIAGPTFGLVEIVDENPHAMLPTDPASATSGARRRVIADSRSTQTDTVLFVGETSSTDTGVPGGGHSRGTTRLDETSRRWFVPLSTTRALIREAVRRCLVPRRRR